MRSALIHRTPSQTARKIKYCQNYVNTETEKTQFTCFVPPGKDL